MMGAKAALKADVNLFDRSLAKLLPEFLSWAQALPLSPMNEPVSSDSCPFARNPGKDLSTMTGNSIPGTRTQSRVISLEEANNMLPLLNRIVVDITSSWEQIILQRTELECLEKNPDQGGAEHREEVSELKGELNRLIDRINGYIREVEELGCFVEEFKRGVINFPSLYVGRKVFLCWKPGDDEVRFWHELDESYSERTPIQDCRHFLVSKKDVPDLELDE